MKRNRPKDARNSELAKIHIAAAQLGMVTSDKDPSSAYRAMLWAIGRVHSAKDLDSAGRARVLDHLKNLGFKPARGKPHPGQPHNAGSQERGGQLGKVEAMLAEAKRPWAYADGMAKRMFNVERVAWCNPEQLQKLIAALTYDQKRRAANSES